MGQDRELTPVVSGWRETLLSVNDIDSWVQAYVQVGDWKVRYEGDVAPEIIEYLHLPRGTRAREVVVGCKDAAFGLVRLVCFDDGNRHPLIRSCGRPWETGGWFDLNLRVDDMGDRFTQLQDLGWGGVSDPIEYDFGPVTVKEWLAYGPDGIHWALIERVHPPLASVDRPGKLGPHFNATQIVDDIVSARHFYEDVLGFNVNVEVDDEPLRPGPFQNVLGLPNEQGASQRWNIAMLKSPGKNGGMVEVISLPGISGRDFSVRANPPNRGIVSLRFPVDDVAALHRKLIGVGVPIINTPTALELPPDGHVTMMTARGPCGARLDFYEAELARQADEYHDI